LIEESIPVSQSAESVFKDHAEAGRIRPLQNVLLCTNGERDRARPPSSFVLGIEIGSTRSASGVAGSTRMISRSEAGRSDYQRRRAQRACGAARRPQLVAADRPSVAVSSPADRSSQQKPHSRTRLPVPGPVAAPSICFSGGKSIASGIIPSNHDLAICQKKGRPIGNGRSWPGGAGRGPFSRSFRVGHS
jgi:hypothetical protein